MKNLKLASIEARIARLKTILNKKEASSLDASALEVIEKFLTSGGKYKGESQRPVQTKLKGIPDIVISLRLGSEGRLYAGDEMVAIANKNGFLLRSNTPSKPFVEAVKDAFIEKADSLNIPYSFTITM